MKLSIFAAALLLALPAAALSQQQGAQPPQTEEYQRVTPTPDDNANFRHHWQTGDHMPGTYVTQHRASWQSIGAKRPQPGQAWVKSSQGYELVRLNDDTVLSIKGASAR